MPTWPHESGEMAERIGAHDWRATPLGPQESWPHGLRNAIDLMLASRPPTCIGWGPDSRLFYNDAFAALLADRHPQALGQPYGAVCQERWNEEQPLLDATLAGEAQFVSMPHFSVAWTPLRDQGGRIAGFFRTATPAHPLAAREAEERFRQFGEASQDVLWIRDARTLQWQYLTPAFETIYGLSRKEALGGDNFRGWLDLIVPEDRPHALRCIQRVRRGEHVTFDYRVERPADGTFRWVRNTDFPITDATGAVTSIGGIGHDLTELVETERRLHALVDGIPQLVWRAAEAGLWTWASPQWTAFTGQSQADSSGWGWLEPIHPDDRASARDAWARAEASGGFQVEHRIRARDGSARWFATRASPVRDPSGVIVEWLGTSTDIHDLRVLQDRQRVLVAELRHRTRNLMAVVRSVADRTLARAVGLTDFRENFWRRLAALARVQDLLFRMGEGQRITFDDLLRRELAALDDGSGEFDLFGPEGVVLQPSSVQMLALALHELGTNAVKHGALSQPQGRLDITWHVARTTGDARPWLSLDWREHGVHMIGKGAQSGSGRELIERALPYQLGARTTWTMQPGGVHCTIGLPVSDPDQDAGFVRQSRSA